MERICYIICAWHGEEASIRPLPGDFVIAADGGYQAAAALGVVPDLVVGDFDSLGYVPEGVPIERHPVMKDDTDAMLAARLGMERGYQNFVLVGAIGGRLDHTIANLQILAYLSERGMQGYLFDKDSVFTAITDRELVFDRIDGGYVSVFSWSERSVGVYLKNLKYELHDALLTNDFPLGVSNEFIGKESSILVRSGTLLVNFPRAASGRIL